MAQRIYHFKGYTVVKNGVEIKLNLDRFSKQYNEAQAKLDSMVMTSMVPFMPHDTGNFIDQTRSKSVSMEGTGQVCAGIGPYGRYLYMGKVMVDEKTGKGPMRYLSKYGAETFRFRKGAKLKATERNLKYSDPKTRAKWFDHAKKADGKNWIEVTKKTAGGG